MLPFLFDRKLPNSHTRQIIMARIRNRFPKFSRLRRSFALPQLLTRALLYCCLGVLGLAIALGTSSVSARQVPPSPDIAQQAPEPSDFLQRGKQLYDEGLLSEAISAWQEAVTAFDSTENRADRALAWNYISLAYQDLGQWQEAEVAIANSLNLLDGALELSPREMAILAQALNARGSMQLNMGNAKAALESWQRSETSYSQAGELTGVVGSKINQSRALQAMGMYRRARTSLEQIRGSLESQPNSALKVSLLQSLGTTLEVSGDLEQAHEVLYRGLQIARQIGIDDDTSSLLFGLGNVLRDLQRNSTALNAYERAIELTSDPTLRTQILLNRFRLLLDMDRSQAIALLPKIWESLDGLPPSRSATYARVNFAESLMQDAREPDGSALTSDREIADLLAESVRQAEQLQDDPATAYTLVQLGRLYEDNQQWQEAQQLTERALEISQGDREEIINVRGSWQLGRILKNQGKTSEAIVAYRNATETLQTLRQDLIAISTDVQFDFRKQVEPIYRQLVSLLIQADDPSGENLQKARQAIENLRLAEFENFLREACLDAQSVKILDNLDPTAAIVYPIVLPDRLEVILSLPGQPLRNYTTQLPEDEVESILQQFYSSFNLTVSETELLGYAEQVYDWLIRPAEDDLERSNIQTLVFLPDGFMGNIPMGALYDGEKYLVEKYRVAVNQGLELKASRKLEEAGFSTLMVGLTEGRQGFADLPGVRSEIESIAREIPAKVFLDRDFTDKTLQKQVDARDFSLLHMATHGQFSSNPDETFLLTWDGQIGVNRLDEILQTRERRDRKPLELLVLSACQTAAGDDRATLGLAGIALRSGARSTLATLWSVKDESTAELMISFYRNLVRPGTTRAEALRQAQLSLLNGPNYKHPFFWSPFVLVGSWL